MKLVIPTTAFFLFLLPGCSNIRSTNSAGDELARTEQLGFPRPSQSGFSPSDLGDLAALAYCYCRGVDSAGRGDLRAGADELRMCFTEAAEFDFSFPSTYANWNFKVRGPQAFIEHVGKLYQEGGFVRTQHQATNIEAQRTGSDTAIVQGYISAIHVLADDRAYFATALFIDTVEQIDGRWMITHREEDISALTLLPAFPATSD
jgi:hypothetical protein